MIICFKIETILMTNESYVIELLRNCIMYLISNYRSMYFYLYSIDYIIRIRNYTNSRNNSISKAMSVMLRVDNVLNV